MTSTPFPTPEFTDTDGASAFTRIPVNTLVTLRSRGGGPPFIKRGKSVYYSLQSLRTWMREQETSSE